MTRDPTASRVPAWRRAGRLRRMAGLLPSHARTAWWGLLAPRLEQGPLQVVQAVVMGPRGVLLAVRSDLWGHELPGGHPEPDEPLEAALCREVLEETGMEIAVEGLVGEYERTGFRPHRARVYRCRVLREGDATGSDEVVRCDWFDPAAPPDTLLPWYRGPLADAVAGAAEPVRRRERQGLAWILAGLATDARMRWRG